MLNFFRKYQRIFFIVVTITIIVSFTFFGTYNAVAKSSEIPNKVIGKGIDGSQITERELGALCRMIATSPLDDPQGKAPNLLNDSVIQKELIATGMGMMLARRYFEELKPDLEQRLVKIKQYRPFVHPHIPELNLESVWRRFHPALFQHLSQMHLKSDQLTMETLAMMFQLYLDQAQFPADLVKQIFAYQLQQQGIDSDPFVSHADFSLFGFKSLEDWFGPRFVQLAGQWMWNTALVAEKNGYRVSQEEVRAELTQNIINGYRELAPKEALTAEEIDQYYRTEVQHLAGDEATALQAWKKVMLCRRMFQDVGNSVFLDPLMFQQFQTYTKESVNVNLYELPEALRLKDLRSLFRLQVYVDAVARDPGQLKGNLQLPTRFANLDVLEKRAPELIEQQYELEFAVVDRKELLRHISLKETWEWEGQDASWEVLKKQFAELSQAKVHNAAERLAHLDQLDVKQRLKIDQFAREKILDAGSNRIATALQQAQPQTWSGGIRPKGGAFPIVGIQDQPALVELLKQAPIRGEMASQAARAVQEKLNAYTTDGSRVYRICVLKREPKKEMVSFARALYDGTLDQMLDARLEASYPDARKKHAALFQQKDGSWRPLIEVKEAVGKIVYADVLKSIEDAYRALKGDLPGTSGDLPSAFYTQHRLLSYLSEARESIEKKGDDPRWVRSDAQAGEALETQWQLTKTARQIERGEGVGFSKEQMFSLPELNWSSVEVGYGGVLAFYQVISRESPMLHPVESMDQGHQGLSIDAQRTFMSHLLEQFAQKNVIDLAMGDTK